MSRMRWTPRGVVPSAARDHPDRGLWSVLESGAERRELPIEVAFLAWELGRLAAEKGGTGEMDDADRRALSFLALAVLAAEREGSTRVPLEDGLEARFLELGAGPSDIEHALALTRRGGAVIDTVDDGPGTRPLVVAGGTVATQRTRTVERRVAQRVTARLESQSTRDRGEIDAILDELEQRPLRLAAAPLRLSDEQRDAVTAVLTGRLAVITGGPGTGKTSLVAALLRAVARLAEPPLDRVVLVAPTGKAADRLGSSIRRAVDAIEEPAPADRRLSEAEMAGQTLHRLLGASADGRHYLHHERNPIPADLVIVDEASMLDLALADRLLRALLPAAGLVLIGDADQLPSIDPGAVLRDLVEVTARCAPQRLARLTRSFRADTSDPAGRAILAASSAIRDGEPVSPLPERESVAELLAEGVELLSIDDDEGLLPFLEWWEVTQVDDLPQRQSLVEEPLARPELDSGDSALLSTHDQTRLHRLFDHAQRSRIITPVRGLAGGRGAEAINAWFHSRRAPRSGGRRHRDLHPGEPVLVTRNDHRRGLFNGDPGLVMPAIGNDGIDSVVALRRGAGFRLLPLTSLRGLVEPAWATTVHRAQGSEFDRVALVLPERDVRVLSRALVYTAVTRARRSVVVVGSRARIEHAVATTTVRHSGLPEEIAARLDRHRDRS